MSDEKTEQPLISQQRKLQIINALRSFNAFIGTLVSTWSAGVLLVPLILGAILAYFGVLFIFPLWSICLAIGVVALALGIWIARNRYVYLDTEVQSFEFHDVKETEEALEKLSTEEKELGQDLLFWERVNTFIGDSQKIFSLAGIVILLVSVVFGLSVHPAAPVIAAIAAIVYGVFSAFVRGSQVSYRLERSHVLEKEFERGEKLARRHADQAQAAFNDAAIKLNTYKKMVETIKALPDQATLSPISSTYLQTARAKITLPDGGPIDQVQNNAEVAARLELYVNQSDAEFKQCTARKQEISALAGDITLLKLDVHLTFTDQDKWRVGYHLFMGGFGGGSFAYLALSVFQVFVVSAPVLAAIVAGVTVLYGISSAYFKIESIKREKWLAVDYEKAEQKHKQLNELLKKVDEPKEGKVQEENDTSIFNMYSSPLKSNSQIGDWKLTGSSVTEKLPFSAGDGVGFESKTL
jgi:hypothetical protein